MNQDDSLEVILGEIISLQQKLASQAKRLHDSAIEVFGSSNPVVWANKYSQEELRDMRAENTRAFAMWTPEEEELLQRLKNKGIWFPVLSIVFGRTTSSILRKLASLENVVEDTNDDASGETIEQKTSINHMLLNGQTYDSIPKYEQQHSADVSENKTISRNTRICPRCKDEAEFQDQRSDAFYGYYLCIRCYKPVF